MSNLDLYPHFRRTNRAVFGFSGILDPTDCPLSRKACVPDDEREKDCPHFMGHDFNGKEASLGGVAPICCALLLRASLVKAMVGDTGIEPVTSPV